VNWRKHEIDVETPGQQCISDQFKFNPNPKHSWIHAATIHAVLLSYFKVFLSLSPLCLFAAAVDDVTVLVMPFAC